ncbi:MAG: hypothetical protein AB7V36_13545 [Bacteroidales bacterium]
MRIKIKSYGDPGSITDERIGFEVLSDCDLKFFAVHYTYLTDNGGFYNKPMHTYWFSPLIVQAGDKVVLYTKKGVNSIKRNSDGTTTYFFYWGLNSPLLNKEKDGIVLAEMAGWQTKWQ